jgi:hypothetical protein
MRQHASPATPHSAPVPIIDHVALWPDTLPMAEDTPSALPESGPFREAMEGLHVRELPDEGLFQRLFGRR